MTLPSELYTCAQTREIDRLAIKSLSLDASVLMKRAGREAFRVLREQWPQASKLGIFCGSGNNAGDGFVVAALAAQQCLDVQVFTLDEPSVLSGKLSPAAQAALAYAQQEGVSFSRFSPAGVQSWSDEQTVFIDALLGTGLKGELKEKHQSCIDYLNTSTQSILALDLPSGLDGDTGAVSQKAVIADKTITFVALKRGLFTSRAPAHTGELHFTDLDIPSEISEQVSPSVRRIQLSDFDALKQARSADAHKGDCGHLMVIGGDQGMGGAAMLSGESALRSGAGLVSLCTQPAHVPAVLSRLPELMAMGVRSGQELEPCLQRPDLLVLGPGLGQTSWSEQMFQQVLNAQLPVLVDADGLNLLAKKREYVKKRQDWILTPHPGEAARLLGTSTEAVQLDRFAAVRRLQHEYGGVIVLKGVGTLVADSDTTLLAKVGNPGMAVGGMGDVLSGIIAALWVQGFSMLEAAAAGVCIHGDAADFASENEGELGLRASDLMPHIRRLRNADMCF